MNISHDRLFYVTLHSSDRASNRGWNFVSDLPHEVKFEDVQSWRVALVKLICDRPISALHHETWHEGDYWDVCQVHLKEINQHRSDTGSVISEHTIQIAHPDPNLKGPYQQAGKHVFEPENLQYFALSSGSFR